MKTKVKITIGDSIYEIESTYEQGETAIKSFIEKVVQQHLLIIEAKNK